MFMLKFQKRSMLLVLGIYLFMGGFSAAEGQQSAQSANETVKRQRQEWFYIQRAYPLGYIPAGARLKVLDELKQLPTARRQPAIAPGAATQLSTTPWTLIGPQPTLPLSNDQFTGYPTVAGRVTALAFDPRDTTDKTIYLGSAEGGLWVTTNGAQTWTPLTDFEPSLAVGSVALDPSTNPTTIYIGTGEENFNNDAYYGAGVLKSTDGGKTWTQDLTFSQASVASPTASGPYIGALAVDPFNNQILLAGVGTSAGSPVTAGIWRSTNGGNTWAIVLPESASGNGTGVVFDANSSGTAYAALGAFVGNSSNGVYKSIDGGATWTPIPPLSINLSSFGRITLAIGPPAASGEPGELLVAIADDSTCSARPTTCSTNLLGLFKSTDGGVSWTRFTKTPDFCGDPNDSTKGQCWYDMALVVSPTNPTEIYAGGTNDFGGDALTVSADGGNTWSPDLYAGNSGSTVNSAGQLHSDTHAIAFPRDGTVLAVGNDGGIWTTTNVGAMSNVTWNDLGGPLAITQFYPGISIVPGSPNTGLGGTQDNGTQLYTGKLEWQQISCGDGASTAITPNGATAYIACAANEGLFSTSIGWAGNGIGTCTTMVTSNCYQADFVPPLAMDPENPSILYFGAQAPSTSAQVVYQTTNGAQSWQRISSDLSGGQAGPQITTIGVAPTDSDVVYAGTNFGTLWQTNNATAGTGSRWQEVNSGLPSRFLTDVVIDPSSPSIAYVAYSGFSSCSACDGNGHLFKTTNGGTSWTNITGNLPDIPVNALVVDPEVTNTIYAATDVGVFATTNGGNTWTPLVTGLPNVAVLGLALDPSTRTLWAGTHGRSMWASQLLQPPTATPSTTSLKFANQDVGSTSAAQIITLANSGAMPLTITGITTSTDFAQTNNCGASLAAGFSCTINLSFIAPATPGAVTGTFLISDNLRTSPQTIALTGTAQDFSVSISPNIATVSRGSSATYTVTVSPVVGSFTNSVSLSCSGLPSLASCSFSPTAVTPGSGPTPATLTLTTTAASSGFQIRGRWPDFPVFSLWLGSLLALLAGVIHAKESRRKLAAAFTFGALVVCLASVIVSCSGGNNAPSGPSASAPSNPGTPAGSYTVSVTGTSNQLQRSATVTLTVQ